MARAGEPEYEAARDNWDEYVQPNLCRSPAYPYRKLIDNDIRLLSILPGHGILECILHQMPLVKEQIFYALSYVWGDAREMEEIILDGQPFQVTRNLHGALQQLREQPESPVKIGYPDDYFWIDAMCLNQQDVEEKSHQVPRMMEIYQAALKTVIWLGPNKPIAKLKMHGELTVSSPTNPVELLRLGVTSADSVVGLLFERAGSLWTSWELPDDEAEEESVLHEVFGESYGAVLRASAELLRRPWFERVWTIQECSLGINTSVLAGGHGVELDRLIKLLKVLADHHRLILLAPGYTRIHALGQIDKKWHLKQRLELQGRQLGTELAECILEILSYIKDAQATDPRDQIYGLLGLVTYFFGENLPVELRPDYRLSFEHVYWQYAAYLVQHSGDLRLLLTERYKLQGVPSWVPDFRYLKLRGEANCEATVSVSPDKRMLYLQGIRMEPICDQIDEWNDPRLYPDGIQPGLHDRIRYVEGRIFKPASQIRDVALEGIVDDFLWKTAFVFKGGGMHGMRRAYSDLRGKSSRNGAWLPKIRRAKTMDAFGKDFAIADDFRRSIVLLEDGTILCVSRSEVEVMSSDLVCLFKGATCLSIMRPSRQGDSFILLSHCDVRFGTFFRQQFNEEFWAGRELEEFRVI